MENAEAEDSGRGGRAPSVEVWSTRQPVSAGGRQPGGMAGSGVKTTWELLLPIWDIEDRPEAMQHEETVNAMTLDNVFAYKSHYEQQTKKEGKGDSAFGKDRRLPTKRYTEEDDNCGDCLHEVRFERGPVVEDAEFWKRMPLKRKDTYRHLPMEQEGAEGCINENVITRAHDRSLPLRLRMFSRGNFAKKGFSTGGEVKEPAGDWEAPKGQLAVQEALCNFGDVYRVLWPLDNTPRRLERVMIHFEFGSRLNGSEKEKSKLLELFCDRVMRENSSRAVREKAPLTYRQAKERWRDCVEECGLREGAERKHEEGKREDSRRSAGGGGGGKGRGGGTDGQRGGADGDGSKTARFNGNLVCFHYNNRNSQCTRKPSGDGCDNNRGGVFAHVCNFQHGNGRWCFGKHRRHEQH